VRAISVGDVGIGICAVGVDAGCGGDVSVHIGAVGVCVDNVSAVGVGVVQLEGIIQQLS